MTFTYSTCLVCFCLDHPCSSVCCSTFPVPVSHFLFCLPVWTFCLCSLDSCLFTRSPGFLTSPSVYPCVVLSTRSFSICLAGRFLKPVFVFVKVTTTLCLPVSIHVFSFCLVEHDIFDCSFISYTVCINISCMCMCFWYKRGGDQNTTEQKSWWNLIKEKILYILLPDLWLGNQTENLPKMQTFQHFLVQWWFSTDPHVLIKILFIYGSSFTLGFAHNSSSVTASSVK